MGRSRKKKPLYEQVTITDIGAEGKALARVNDMVVFTTHAIPGDVVDLQVTKKRKKYQEARIVKIHEKSADRVEAFASILVFAVAVSGNFYLTKSSCFISSSKLKSS